MDRAEAEVLEDSIEGRRSVSDDPIRRSVVKMQHGIDYDGALRKHDIIDIAFELEIDFRDEYGRCSAGYDPTRIIQIQEGQPDAVYVPFIDTVIDQEPSIPGFDRGGSGPDLFGLPFRLRTHQNVLVEEFEMRTPH